MDLDTSLSAPNKSVYPLTALPTPLANWIGISAAWRKNPDGSGSSVEEIREAIGYGVIKMNIDTDLQFAFTEGIRDYMQGKADYLGTQIGNPDGAEQPNKKYYDPRKWLREGELTFKERLKQAFADLNNIDTL